MQHVEFVFLLQPAAKMSAHVWMGRLSVKYQHRLCCYKGLISMKSSSTHSLKRKTVEDRLLIFGKPIDGFKAHV